MIARNNQSLKGAVVVTLCQNEADVKCQMDIDSHISLTEQAGKIRLTELSISELEISIGNYTSASFWQRVAPTAPFNTWDKRY